MLMEEDSKEFLEKGNLHSGQMCPLAYVMGKNFSVHQ